MQLSETADQTLVGLCLRSEVCLIQLYNQGSHFAQAVLHQHGWGAFVQLRIVLGMSTHYSSITGLADGTTQLQMLTLARVSHERSVSRFSYGQGTYL